MTEPSIDELSQIIWDYHHLNHQLEKSDLILALGSNDLRVAERAADLYLQGWAPRLMFSGNVGALTRGKFAKPEAETLKNCSGWEQANPFNWRSKQKYQAASRKTWHMTSNTLLMSGMSWKLAST